MAEVEFFGEQFEVTSDVSEFALMEFAESASGGVDGDSMAGMAALLRLIMECLVEPEKVEGEDAPLPARSRFRALARKNRATSMDLIKVIDVAFQVAAERPTGRSSDSSDGPTATEPRHAASSGGKVSPISGRPDLEYQIRRMQAVSA